jgi:signal transduction histidine kinase
VQVERLQLTANSFSNLVALERWEAEPVDLAELVGDVLGDLAVVRRRGIALVNQCSGPGPALVMGDRQWLRRAVANLVKNSIEALGDAEGEIRVRVLSGSADGGGLPESGTPAPVGDEPEAAGSGGAGQAAGIGDGDQVVLEVEDTAGGVPPERIQELFSPSFSTTTAGSGLGLALVQQVATRCHGRASACNGEHGLLVRIELPRASDTMRP